MPKNYKLSSSKLETPSKHWKRKLALSFTIITLLVGSLWIHYTPPPAPVSKKVLGAHIKALPIGPEVTYTTQLQPLAFGIHTVYSAAYPAGTSRITQPGISGVTTITYKQVTTNGRLHKDFVDAVTTKEPTIEIITTGTGPAQ